MRKGEWKVVVVKGEGGVYNVGRDMEEEDNVGGEDGKIVREVVGGMRKEDRERKDLEIRVGKL